MTIRVALVDLPLLLADIVQDALTHDNDMAVDVVPTGIDLASALYADPDLLVVSGPDPESYGRASALLRRGRPRGLVVVSPDARSAWLHSWCPCAWPLGEVSEAGLHAAVRLVTEELA